METTCHDDEMIVVNSTYIASSSLVPNVNNLPIIHEILLNPAFPIYCSGPSASLEIFLQSHGIPLHDDFQFSQMALIHHLINGVCVYRFHAGCQSVAVANNVPNLALMVSSHVLNAPIDIFRILCKSLGYQCKSDIFEHQQLLRWMRAWHDTLQHGILPNLHNSLKKFEYLTKSEALAMAAGHGLSPLGTLDKIKNTIMAHISEGVCSRFQVTLPPACAKLQADCPNELSQMPDNDDDMRMFFLSELSNNIHRRPLCRLLQLYNIEHDTKASFNVLHRALRKYINQLRKGKTSAIQAQSRRFPPTTS